MKCTRRRCRKVAAQNFARNRLNCGDSIRVVATVRACLVAAPGRMAVAACVPVH